MRGKQESEKEESGVEIIFIAGVMIILGVGGYAYINSDYSLLSTLLLARKKLETLLTRENFEKLISEPNLDRQKPRNTDPFSPANWMGFKTVRSSTAGASINGVPTFGTAGVAAVVGAIGAPAAAAAAGVVSVPLLGAAAVYNGFEAMRNMFSNSNENTKNSENTTNTPLPPTEKNTKEGKMEVEEEDSKDTKKVSSTGSKSDLDSGNENESSTAKKFLEAAAVSTTAAVGGYGASSLFAHRRDQRVMGELDYMTLRDRQQELEKLLKERKLTEEEEKEYSNLLNTLQQLNHDFSSKTM